MSAIWRGLARPERVVWCLWAALSLGLVAYVARFGYDFPYYDAWNLVPLLDGSRHLSADWLWEQHNTHRIPFPKLVLMGLLSATGEDFRAGMIVDALALVAVSALLIGASRRVRGKSTYADAFFPLLLLHWGNFEYLLWDWQLTQLIPVVIVLALLAVVTTHGLRLPTRPLLLSSVGVLLLPLSGVPGLVYAPGLAVWLLLAGAASWRSATPSARRTAICAWCCGGLSLLLVPAYFRGLRPSGAYGGGLSAMLGRLSGDPAGAASTGGEFVLQGLGPSARALAPLASWVLLAAAFAALAGIVHALRKPRAPSHRAGAALLFLAGLAGLIVAVGVTLAPVTTFPNRYALQAVPVLCWIFLVSGRIALPLVARWAQAALAFLAAAALGGNFVAGLDYARGRDRQLAALTAELRAGIPPSRLLAHHQRALFPYPEDGGASFHDSFEIWLEVARRERLGAFAKLERDVPFVEMPVETVPQVVEPPQSTPSRRRAWSFAEPRFVHGIRVGGPAFPTLEGTLTLAWRAGDAEDSPDRRCLHWNPPPNPQDRAFPQLTCWIYDFASEIRLESDRSTGELGALEVSLLVPER